MKSVLSRAVLLEDEECLPQVSREVEEAVRTQTSALAEFPHCSSGFLPALIAIRKMFSRCEDDSR